MPSRIYLIRHGASEGPPALLGQSDPPVSEEGAQQAEQLADRLAGEEINAIVSSPLSRARRTAVILAAHLRAKLSLDPRLSEISYGEWDGLSWGEIERRDPETARQKQLDWFGVTPAGGESVAAFATRVRQAWDELLEHEAERLGVVAHVGVNSLLREYAAGRDANWERVAAFAQNHCESLLLEI